MTTSAAVDDVAREKTALRARMVEWRKSVTPERRAETAQALAWTGLCFVRPAQANGIVSGFASLSDELDCMPLLHRVAGEGLGLALPLVTGRGKPLTFRSWTPGDVMDAGVWGIAQPKADKPVVDPDILLVPLLAVDRSGYRLGYGGGFYDRTLQGLRARKAIIAIGLAYEEQVIDAVPHLDYDEPLDWVLTPAGPLRCGR